MLDMVSHCSQFISDPEVAHLFDDINLKLGMTPRACARFRDTAESMLSQESTSCQMLRSDLHASPDLVHIAVKK